jgi:hypothetical protein
MTSKPAGTLDRRSRVASVLAGAIGGAGIGVLAEHAGGHPVAAAATRSLAAVAIAGLAAAALLQWSRVTGLRGRAPIAQISVAALTCAALAGALVAFAAPAGLAPKLSAAVAASAMVLAVLVLAGRESAAPMWRGIAAIAIGVALLAGNSHMMAGEPLFTIAAVGLAAAFAGGGVGALFRDDLFLGVPTLILGATALCLGVAAAFLGNLILGGIAVLAGLALLPVGALICGLNLRKAA